MKKFLKKSFLILIPLFLLIASMEIVIRHIPNDYSIKNKVMTEKGSDFNIVCLGNSQTYYGINPEFFDKPAYNCAHVSQQLHVDNFIFNKFVDQLDNLDYLFLNISYFSHLQSAFDGQEAWRIKYYYLYYDYPRSETPFKYQFELYNLNFNSLLNIIKGCMGQPLYHIDNNGFGTIYTLQNKPASWEDCEYVVKNIHKIPVDSTTLVHNYECVDNIAKKCREKGVKLILFTTPCWHTYTENVDKEQLKSSVEFAQYFANNYDNVYYLDMFIDDRFVADDFYDAYHLSDVGAKKLTLILNDYLKTMAR